MKKWTIELPDDFEDMSASEQEKNLELAYMKRKPCADGGFTLKDFAGQGVDGGDGDNNGD